MSLDDSHATRDIHAEVLTATRTLNRRQVDELADGATDIQRAEHVRGMVAATMSNLPADASAEARAAAQQWQAWALGLAHDLDPRPPA